MSFAVYIHWPFCKSKCPYCDFNSHVSDSVDHARWKHAYRAEIAHAASLAPGRMVDSIFFGGGTPSLMQPETVADIIETVKNHWKTADDLEITLEANPTSIEIDKFRLFREAGVNRVSVGIQALNDHDLKFLGREHSAGEGLKAIDIAAKTFDRFSFDLIYARPGQTLDQWKSELTSALTIARSHLSLYQLTIEQGTPFYTWHNRGDFKIPDQDLAADFYEMTDDITSSAGMPAYEVSNHAVPGQESRHNLVYWRYGDYAGIGPGAHGRITIDGIKHATRTHRAPEIWLDRVEKNGHGLHPFDVIDSTQRVHEALLMGLRLSEGVPWDRLNREYGGDARAILDQQRQNQMNDEGLLADDGKVIRATDAGRRCLNAVLRYWLAV